MGDWDPDAGLFDDDEDREEEAEEDYSAGKELIVYLVDSSFDMLQAMPGENPQNGNPPRTYMTAVLNCIEEDLKTRIISQDADQVGVVFFNTRKKKNIQESEGVYVLAELDVPSAQLIKNVSSITERFEREIGGGQGVLPGSRENPLYNALWVAQAMFRTGPATRVSKKIFLFTNNDDPFGEADPLTKADMRRTTVQRAQDARDLGIDLELYPMSRPGEEFNVRIIYADMVHVEGDVTDFMNRAPIKFEDLKMKMKKRAYKKRMVRRMTMVLEEGLEIALTSYAMIRTARIAKDVYVDAKDNVPIKAESSLICQDTGAILTAGSVKRALPYGSSKVLFTPEELREVKRVTSADMRLLGFKPISCLRDYHNLSPSTFLYPDDQGIKGSTCAAIALHTAMVESNKMALACWGKPSALRLVALIAQPEKKEKSEGTKTETETETEEEEEGWQVEPPGFQMIYLPFLDDIRTPEQHHPWASGSAPRASPQQMQAAAAVVHKINLQHFSMLDIQNPALQTHYAILQAMALQEETLPEVTDDTMPEYEKMSHVAVRSAVGAFKDAVYGADHEKREAAQAAAVGEKGQKRKAKDDAAAQKAAQHDWHKLADDGKLTTLTIEDLKDFLRVKGLPLSGKKQDLIDRILGALGK